ncbi:MAG: hypothetical protein RLZ10_608 [Bacteroidota bacterium]|jgi:protein TonB
MKKILILFIILGFKVSGQNQELQTSQNENPIKTTEINGHWWTKLNLNVTTFRNGDPIYLVLNEEEWDYCVKNKVPAMMHWKFDKLNEKLGYLYNYWAFVDSRELAPYGFRIPNLKEIEGSIDDLTSEFKSPIKYAFPENSILKVDFAEKKTNNNVGLSIPNFYSGKVFNNIIFTVVTGEHIFTTKVQSNIQSFWCFYPQNEDKRGDLRNDGYFLRCIKDSSNVQSIFIELNKPIVYLKDQPEYIELAKKSNIENGIYNGFYEKDGNLYSPKNQIIFNSKEHYSLEEMGLNYVKLNFQINNIDHVNILSVKANDFLSKKYNEVIPIAKGLFKVKNNNLCGLIDSIGTEILKPRYLDVYVCKSNHKTLILIKNNSYDTKWRVYSSMKVQQEFPIQNFKRLTYIKNTNFISVLISEIIQGYPRDMYGIIDFENKIIIKPGKFIYNNKLCHYGYIDNKLNENLIRFSIGENDPMSYLVGFLDKKGNIKIKPFYTDYIEDFRSGIAGCSKADINKQKAFFFLTKNGKFIKMNEYDKINSPIDKNLLKQQTPPSFQGGSGNLDLYLKSNLKYSQEFLKKIKYGTSWNKNNTPKTYACVVQFTINSNGTTNDFKILSPIGYGCDDEAIRVLKSTNKWIPLTINDEPVKSEITIVIDFGGRIVH